MARRGTVEASRRGRTPAEEKRPLRPRHYRYLFLIVCEDQATEPAYFEDFLAQIPKKTIWLRTVGTGLDPLGIVQRAQWERDLLADEAGREVDEVWLVFDKDDADRNPGKQRRFEQALTLAATEKKFHLAFSNEVFELWLLLHLQEVDASLPLHREEIYRQLGEAIRQGAGFAGFQYAHRETPADATLAAVAQLGDEEAAHRRAAALLAHHGARPLLETNPSTRVHLLVRSLRAWIAFYQ